MMELEKIPLDPGSKDLKSEIENKEIPSTPPEEENKAKEINVAGIIGIMFVLIAVIMLIVVIFKGGKKKKDVENKELDKAGSKVEFNFDRVQEKKQEVIENLEKKIEGQKDDKQESSQPTDEELLKNVNEKIHPSKTQSNYQPQNYSSPTYKSDRPDTRNSRSPRKGRPKIQLQLNKVKRLLLVSQEMSSWLSKWDMQVCREDSNLNSEIQERNSMVHK